MDDTTKKIILTLGAGLLKKVGITIGMAAATHGWISGNDVELVGAGAVALGSVAYSFWNDYGKAIVLSQLDVLKAKSLAQADQARKAGLPPVTVAAIADKSPTLTPADVTKVVAKLLIAAFVMTLFLAGDPALAQSPKLTGNIARDIATANAPPPKASSASTFGALDGALSDFNGKLQAITKELVDKAIADVTAAQTDAQNHNDAISKPCWDANLLLLKSLPTQWETPPTLPLGLALTIQIQRDLLNSITGNDINSLKVACAALWGDQLKIVANVAGLLGIRIATGGLF